jgi:hypothetical protein
LGEVVGLSLLGHGSISFIAEEKDGKGNGAFGDGNNSER